MLTHIEIEGFRSFRDTRLDLSGLTVLIGPNGSGKSNFLDVFALMASSSVGRLSDGIAKRGGINTLLFRGHDKVFLSFEILGNVYEDFRHISFPAEGGDGKILLRGWEHPFEKDNGFSANLLSDGTLRLLSLLAILKTPDPPPLICIDEPEAGLHPDWIRLVAELLESAATRTQVIVTTHSPELVSHIKPQHVVVVEKEEGATTLSRLTEDELANWLDKFRLGDLWLAGHIGGRP